MKTTDINLTEGPIGRRLLEFFFPVLFGMLFQMLYNMVDAVIVGKGVGYDALAAVGGSAAQVANLMIGFFNGLATGTTVLVSQYYGARDEGNMRKIVSTSFLFYAMAGAVLTAVGLLITPWALRILKNPADIMDMSVEYLSVYFCGALPLLLYNMGAGVLRAVGDSRRPLIFLMAGAVTNILLDCLLVLVLRKGVAGAAWATVASEVLSCALTLGVLMKSREAYRLDLKSLKLHGNSLKRMLLIGIPAGIQSMMYSVSNTLIQSSVNGFGTEVVAAWTAIGKFDNVFWVTSNAFGTALCSFAGQNYGAGKYDRMRKGMRRCMLYFIIATLVLCPLLLVFGDKAMLLFTDEPAVIDYAVQMLWGFVPFYVIWVFVEMQSSQLRGMGDAVKPTIIVILGVCGIRIVWLLTVMPRWHTIRNLCYCYPVSWVITAVALFLYLRKSPRMNLQERPEKSANSH